MNKCVTEVKHIDTLVEDIYSLVKNGSEISDEQAKEFGDSIAKVVQTKLKPRNHNSYLRLSNLGKPNRQLYYELKGFPKEEMLPHTYLKFLIGDVWESVLLFLAKACGHKVEGEQEKLTIEGVDGHRDAKIDNVTVDVKSASTYSFKKFEDGSLRKNDPFGYISQIAAYHNADTDKTSHEAAFLAGDKQNGHITLMKVDELELPDTKKRIIEVKEMLAKDELPDRCYPALPSGKSGNMKLGIECSYCSFKKECWKDANNGVGIRTFIYSTYPEHLVKVVREPKVYESK